MNKYYITFGQVHVHSHAGKTLDKDCVGVITAPSEEEARKKAFEWFGAKWSRLLKECPDMDWFPRGLIEL